MGKRLGAILNGSAVGWMRFGLMLLVLLSGILMAWARLDSESKFQKEHNGRQDVQIKELRQGLDDMREGIHENAKKLVRLIAITERIERNGKK